jgi:hypothetical protein
MVVQSPESIVPPDLAAYLAQTAPAAHPDIFDLYKDWEANRGKAFSRRDSQEKGGWGQMECALVGRQDQAAVLTVGRAC